MNDGMTQFFGFLRRLEQRRIHCTIEFNPNDSLLIVPDVPGRKTELEFFVDRNVAIFRSNGIVRDESAMDTFFRELNDPATFSET